MPAPVSFVLRRETSQRATLGLIALFSLCLSASAGRAQDDDDPADDDLAKQSQNPISDLISVPFQNNTNFRQGRYNQTGNILNIQPVVPVKINEDWNVISRTIIPIVHQVRLTPGIGPDLGLGDINPTLFFSPSKPTPFLSGNVVAGLGPTFLFPTSTGPTLGARRWASGIAGVGVYLDGPWVIGLLASNLWSFAPPYSRDDVRLLSAQYFINYNMKGGWYLTSSPIISADWTAAPGNQWTVPFGGGLGRVFKIGGQPVNVSLAAYYNAVRPDNAAAWQLRFAFALLFPTK